MQQWKWIKVNVFTNKSNIPNCWARMLHNLVYRSVFINSIHIQLYIAMYTFICMLTNPCAHTPKYESIFWLELKRNSLKNPLALSNSGGSLHGEWTARKCDGSSRYYQPGRHGCSLAYAEGCGWAGVGWAGCGGGVGVGVAMRSYGNAQTITS